MPLKLKKNEYLKIKVIPHSSKTEIKGEMADGTLKIAVAAVPEKGKANAALVDFLAVKFKVAKNGIKIISGAGARIKLIKIEKI
jgi:uncharacterized protein (TIGR00251 family)